MPSGGGVREMTPLMAAFERSDWRLCWDLLLGPPDRRDSAGDVAWAVPSGGANPGYTVLHVAAYRWASADREHFPRWMWDVYQERLGPSRPRPAPASARLAAAAAVCRSSGT